jgi:hypothetical protein
LIFVAFPCGIRALFALLRILFPGDFDVVLFLLEDLSFGLKDLERFAAELFWVNFDRFVVMIFTFLPFGLSLFKLFIVS